jgi:hypothetical protein
MATTIHPPAGAGAGTSDAHDHDPVLERLLDAELDYDPVARRGFINHTAMALVAARRLGAGDSDLERWFRDDTTGDFLVPRARPDWLGPLSDEVRERGADVVTAERLPQLVGAPGSQLFHAVIRLELALDAGHPGQVANALRNWADHDDPLGPAPDARRDRDVASVLAALREERVAGRLPELGAHELAQHPLVGELLDTLAVHDHLLDELAASVAAIHADAGDFGTLHLVTGTRAVRAVADRLDDEARRELAVRAVQAVALLWLTFGAPAPADAEQLDRRRAVPTDWATTSRRAIDTGDHHVVKLVYAARLEHATTGDPLYGWLAAREAGAL